MLLALCSGATPGGALEATYGANQGVSPSFLSSSCTLFFEPLGVPDPVHISEAQLESGCLWSPLVVLIGRYQRGTVSFHPTVG